uniref:CD166 antigen n=1 Tax=Phallusia mammillata TaxID=59560 RepID=A0A6F9D711_9ASCI|nr:CD166 antigen [Phallusia mammillata]
MDLYLILGFLLCTNFGLSSAEFTAKYTGEKAYPLNSNATLKCQADPIPEANAFQTFWFHVGADGIPKKFAVSTSDPATSYVYNDAPDAVKGRFIMDNAEFLEIPEGPGTDSNKPQYKSGTAMATLVDVQVTDEGEYECEAEDTAKRATGRTRFNLNVYSIPTVSIEAITSSFNLRPIPPTEAPEIPEETPSETPTGEEVPAAEEVPTGDDAITSDDVAAGGSEGDMVAESTEAPITTTTPSGPEPTSVANCYINFVYPKPAIVSFTGYTANGASVSLGDIPTGETIQNADGTFNITSTLSLNVTKDLDQVQIECSVEVYKKVVSSELTPPYTVFYDPDNVQIKFSRNMPTVGDLVMIDCIANGNPLPITSLTLPTGEEVSVPYDLQVQKSSAGMYTCKVPSSEEDIEDNKDLFVHWTDKPTLTVQGNQIAEDTAIEANLGDTVELHCKAKGNPTPSFTWLKNGEPLSTGKTLTLKKVYFTNSAEYTCEARGAMTLSTKFQLEVKSGCTLEFTKTVSASSVKEGNAFVGLTCKAIGNPPCQVTIYDAEGNELKSGTSMVEYNQPSVEVQINPLVYMCEGKNNKNATSRNVKLDDPLVYGAEPQSSGLGAGVIIIIIILVALVLVGVPLAWYCIKKKNAPKAPPAEKDAEAPHETEKLKSEENDGNRA